MMGTSTSSSNEGTNVMMRMYLAVALLFLLPSLAAADQATDAARCQQADGSFLVGTVTDGPAFRGGRPLRGVHLSHTHLTLLGDDGTSYDVAIDNVFANGYHRNQNGVPTPLNSIRIGDKLELCGQPYSGGDVAIHFVHTNRGATPSPDKPDGWVRKLDAAGDAGDNMEANQAFCSLFPN
jgi:hypothetical protein